MMLFTFMVLFTTIISTVDSACIYCKRCVDDKCDKKCWCEKGCKPGYFGNICGQECPHQCASCGRQYGLSSDTTYHKCYECSDEYHNGSSTNCLCRLNCEQCESTTACTVCNSGWYGVVCESPCPQDCLDNVCSKSYGSCTQGCVNGKYGTHCQFECPATCSGDVCDKTAGICTNGCIANFAPGVNSTCNKCLPGKYNNNCKSDCLSTTCFNNECDRGIGTCSNGCMGNFAPGDNKLCDVCKPGKYDLKCATNCSTTECLNNECDRENGTCSKGCTSPNLIGTYCNACINGMYGNICQLTCPNNCKDNVCDRYQGTCTNGCQTDQFTGNKCIDCTGGYYGEHCNTICPVNCKYKTCTKDKGECAGGCVDNFTGLKCDACKVGFYGTNCVLPCPSASCNDNVCDSSTGQCEKCSPGMYGSFCNQTCSVGCILNECVQLNGNCKNGCKNGYSGNKCCNSKGYCEQCRNTTHCTQCITGYFGDNCIKSCPENCANGCSMGIGQCTSCNLGYFGPECNQICSGNCFEGICDQEAGNCLKCISGYHGGKCGETCSNNCVNNACFQDDSKCIDGCTDDFQGQDCSEALSLVDLPVAGLVGSVVGFLVLITVAVVGLIFFRRRKRRADHQQSAPKECPRGMKCEQYWPVDGQTCVYGDITVTYQGINAYAEYCLTRMTIAKGKQQRHLTHVQYTSWPDKSVPDNVVSLVEFRQRVKAIKTVTGGPTIVHCSAGVGRTGTYIALDILTDQGKAEHTVNVFDCVMKLREQRVNMVQTHEQYEYLYRGIVYTLTFGSDPVMVNILQTDVAKLNDKWYAKQFQLLENEIETEPGDEEEAREVNKLQSAKNRQGADIPGNKARPRLLLNRAFNEPDFINAIYINSFKKMNRFIAAQTPLPASLSDFLCLIYQNKCSCIVDMNDTVSYDKHQVGMYLPDINQTVEVDSYTVSCSDREMKSTYIKSILLVNNSSKQRPGQMVVEHYQYTGWRYDGEVPNNVGQFVQFVNTVQIAADSQTEDLSPMLIHCLNAFERSGLFCTLAVLLEKLECEQQVSIVNTIRQIRLRRYKAIPNKAQYKFCHECAAAYTDMFSTYSNFAV